MLFVCIKCIQAILDELDTVWLNLHVHIPLYCEVLYHAYKCFKLLDSTLKRAFGESLFI